MSCYTTLKLKVNFKNKLTKLDINSIEDEFINDCGCDSYKKINESKTEFKIEFNYGLKTNLVNLLNKLEKYIKYDSLTKIGTFETEEIRNLVSGSDVYIYKNKIFILKEDCENYLGFSSYKYYLSDLRGILETYYEDVDNDTKIFGNDLTKKIINNFIKEELNL